MPSPCLSCASKPVHALSCFVAGATLFLITLGGLVTSHNAGLSVPDWPTSYGYNMFLFPWNRWTGSKPIFLEHSHRLVASGLGVLTILLAVSLARARVYPAWTRRLGWIALAAVIIQGILGGLRVTWLKDEIGIFHACLAHSFLAFVSAIALFTSPWWQSLETQKTGAPGSTVPSFPKHWLPLVGTIAALIFLQLLAGACMRHAHAGLSIPDFPKAYGQWWPPMDTNSLQAINQERWARNEMPTTTTLIALQMTHRIGAVLTFVLFAAASIRLWKQKQSPVLARRWMLACLGLVAVQILLGASTIWSNKAADIATAHTAIGAVLLTMIVLLALISARLERQKLAARS